MADSTENIASSLVPLSREQARILLEAGYLSMDLGQFEVAREIIAGAAVLMPKSEIPHLALGTLEFARGHSEKALQAYRVAQKLAPRSGLPRAHAGEALLFMGKVPEAMKELRAAQDLEPGGEGARFALSLIEAQEAGALPPPETRKK